MFNLPSLDFIITKSSAALRRFPLVILSGIVAAIASIYLSEIDYDSAAHAPWIALIMVSILGISLFFGIRLMGERRGWSNTMLIGANITGLIILSLYFFLLPDDFDTAPHAVFFRYILYLLGSHLLVSAGPYLRKGSLTGFWQYNKTLFLRFLTAVLFSGVLFVGLTIALGSIDVLLDVDIDSERYFQLFVLVGAVFNTWFFVSGIPEPIELLDRVQDYPKGLKIFTQNILIPLVTIYVIILYLYTAKIILAWSWPEGWVAYLVLSFSIVGIFALLLLHPIQEHVENRWIKKFSKSYFYTLLPLIMLLLLAIWRRIWEYSFTVNRYFVLVLGLWLAGIVLYFILSKTKNIKVIPASLGIIAILISFGPWGAFSVSEHSQKQRLEEYLSQNSVLIEGTIQKTSEAVPFDDRKEISSILRYLNDMHGISTLQPWFEDDLTALTKPAANADTLRPVYHHEIPTHLTRMMGMEYVEQWQDSAYSMPQRTFSSRGEEVIAIAGFDWIMRYQYPRAGSNNETSITLGKESLSIRTVPEHLKVMLFAKDSENDTLEIDLTEMVQDLQKRYSTSESYNIRSSDMMASDSTSWSKAAIHLTNITVGINGAKPAISSFSGRILIKIYQEQ